MTVRLESSIKRYIGTSSDVKPRPGIDLDDGTTITDLKLPAGSSFLEEDTGRIWRWTGAAWAVGSSSDDVAEATLAVMAALLAEVRASRKEERTGLPERVGAL